MSNVHRNNVRQLGVAVDVELLRRMRMVAAERGLPLWAVWEDAAGMWLEVMEDKRNVRVLSHDKERT